MLPGDVRLNADVLAEGSAELAQRLDEQLALLRITRVDQRERDDPGAVDALGKEGQRRRLAQDGPHRKLVRGFGDELAVALQHRLRLGDRVDDEAAQHVGPDRVEPELEAGDHAEVAAAAAESPEQVRVLGRARAHHLTCRSHDLGGLEVVDRHAVLATEPAEATAQRQSCDAGGGVDPHRCREAVGLTARLDGGGRDRATIVCGFLGLGERPFNLLLGALPRVLHVSGATLGPDSWVASFVRAAVVESNHRRPGGEAVLERMSEMLFVEVLRRHIDALPAGQTGWLAGMRDPSIGRVLALLHEKPDAPWTLERLADDAAMSRSTLHERFVHFIGQPPMQYLAQWRMQVAARLLRDTKAKLVEVALGVGYESEAAFSRAFKRTVGVAPGAWRAGRRPGVGVEAVSP